MKIKEELEEPALKEEEMVKQHILARAEISLLLDDYDDIFSDFDPRPYTSRALSDDFLLEAKKVARDKSGAIELNFLIPKTVKNSDDEILIKRRLREHFKKHALLIEDEINAVKRKGIFMALLGIFFIIIATTLAANELDSWFIHFIIIILEPAGWFTAWTGLDELYYKTKEMKPDLDFYRKMSNSDIQFHMY